MSTQTATQLALYIFLACMLALLSYQWVLFARVRRMSNQRVAEAARLEAQGQYPQACLQYALALMNNPARPADCRARIRDLWRRFGPFDFSGLTLVETGGGAGLDCSPMECEAAIALIETLVSDGAGDVR